MSQPDVYTNANWNKQMRAIQFSVNQACAEYVSADERIQDLVHRVDSLEGDLELAQAEIGRLREELEVSLEKMREAWKKLTNGS